MPTPAEADAIARLSAFALFVLLTMFAGIALWRRWIVLGWFYDEERKARLTAETQSLRSAEALEANNLLMAEQTKALIGQGRELAGLRRDVKSLRDEIARRDARMGHA